VTPLLNRLRGGTPVERYWSRHTVNSTPFRDAKASADYLEWRFAEYPLFRELTGLWGDHSGELVLDHGCGPGNDLVGFLLYSGAATVVGADVSMKALQLAQRRLALHDIEVRRYGLVHLREAERRLPFDDRRFDHISSLGVLHHVSDPLRALQELRRVLKRSGTCTIMVYNRDSVYFHLYTAYMRRIVASKFAGLPVEEAFRRNTDGPKCPVSRAYRGSDFLALCEEAGLAGEFAGGYFLKDELDWLNEHREAAVASPRLEAEHREFLAELEQDDAGRPSYRGKPAGIGGVYQLRSG